MFSIGDTPWIQKSNVYKIKGWKKIHHANNNHKHAEVAILIPENIAFKTNKKVTRYEKGHFMIKKREDTKIFNIFSLNKIKPKYMKKKIPKSMKNWRKK